MARLSKGGEERKKEIEEVKKEEKITPFGNTEHSENKFQGGKEKPVNIK